MKQEALRLKNIHAAQKVAWSWSSRPSLPSSLTSKKMKPQVGTITYNGGSYTGEIKNGQPNGDGILTKDGNTYEGSWKAGKPNGKFKVSKQYGLMLYDGYLITSDSGELQYHGKGILTVYRDYKPSLTDSAKDTPTDKIFKRVGASSITYEGKWLNNIPEPDAIFNVKYYRLYDGVIELSEEYYGTLDRRYKRSGYKGKARHHLHEGFTFIGKWKNDNPDQNYPMKKIRGSFEVVVDEGIFSSNLYLISSRDMI
jgi:hypothetical protein